jgi:hypothetical protein
MTTWRKSSYSGQGGTGECIEIARFAEAVAVRDSKAPNAGCLRLSPSSFVILLDHLKSYRPTT